MPPPAGRSFIALLAATAAAGSVASNLYLPALPAVQAGFGASVAQVNVTVSAALLAFAAGVLVLGPLSDRHGRRPVLLGGLGLYALGNLACLLAPTLGWLVAGRMLQSFGAAAGMVVVRAVLGDLYSRERMAHLLATITMVMVVSPMIAPLLGGLLTEAFGWHAVFACLLGLSLLILAVAARRLPETRPRALRVGGGGELWRAALGLLRQPQFLACLLQGSVVYATFLVFTSLVPYVVVQLGHPVTAYGSWYVVAGGGYFAGNWLVTRLGPRLGLRRLLLLGAVLQFAGFALGAVLALAGCWQLAAIFLPMLVVGIGQGLALPNITAAAVALAPRTPGSASSVLGFGQQLAGALAVQALGAVATGTPVPIYLFCTAATAVALAAALRPAHSGVGAD